MKDKEKIEQLTISLPEYEGYLVIGQNVRIGIEKYPNWLHRIMMRLVFGFGFIREQKEETK